MLHFLISVAVCLFIGERLVHYWSAYRQRRDERRYMALLYPPPPPPPKAPRRRFLETDFGRYALLSVWLLAVVTVLVSAFGALVVG
jgi:hypothetical protein